MSQMNYVGSTIRVALDPNSHAHRIQARPGPATRTWAKAWARPLAATAGGLHGMSRASPWPAMAGLSDPPTIPPELPPNPVTPEPPAHPVESPPSENPVPVREPPHVKPPVAADGKLHSAGVRDVAAICEWVTVPVGIFLSPIRSSSDFA